MNILSTIRERFRPILTRYVDQPDELLEMIRPSQDARFGDYQANFAMPLGKRLQRPPREVAAEVANALQIDDLCQAPEVAGPGFINLRLLDSWLRDRLQAALDDERLAISTVDPPRTFIVDYSSPNVAKAMHVGHIRSTVIGDAICRVLRFIGHQAISDNHLGDWGTQFGMIIYGYKNFVDPDAYQRHPVQELGRLYKLVSQLVDYQNARNKKPEVEQQLAQREKDLAQLEEQLAAEGPQDKKSKKELRRMRNQVAEVRSQVDALLTTIRSVEEDEELAPVAEQHAKIDQLVLKETAKLHADDAENVGLWQTFLPHCLDDIRRIYDRIDIQFDEQLGESFYHDRLAAVVSDFEERGAAKPSDGAICIFLDGFKTPMIIRKKDGAFLYATTDLATIQYRMERWNPAAILYVVDHRQSEHFEKLFAAARLWGYADVDLQHISFGTVLGEDGRPYRTRSGDVVGLEGLLDEAIQRAYAVVSANDDSKPNGAELNEAQRQAIANTVGHAALKYADLSHNRTSDYVFNYDKMVALEGNTATYMQYSYARTQSIFARGHVDIAAVRQAGHPLLLENPFERDLALELIRFGDALEEMLVDYRPNILTNYLFALATKFSRFYHECEVISAETDALRNSRLQLCDLTGRTIRQGLDLLGIGVVDKM
jgi:arginyl-tRNA synthetase